MGQNIMEVTPTLTSKEKAAEIMERLRAGKNWSGEFPVQRRDGSSVPAIVTDTPIRDEEGNLIAIIGVTTDITERKAAEEKIAHYATELERSNRDLEQFAYIVSHDLREPLRTVTGYLGLLDIRYRGQLDAKADLYIDYAVSGAERMQEMIRALLNLSRVGTRGKPFAPVDVERVLEHVLDSLEQAIVETDAEINYESLPTVMADKTQLAQVFQNLIANAIKFRREDVPPRVDISAERQESAWLFSVADNGIGIDPEQKSRLFKVFQRLHTDSEYPGVGIGLALSRRIVKRHQGKIWVESAPGKGATFKFTLPVTEEPA
jgi:light-regulated signal transduction histidine kinase (bacteriophytochrome)